MVVRYDMLCDPDSGGCGRVLEVVRKSGDTDSTPCPDCGGLMHWMPSCQAQPEFKPVWHEHLDNEPVLLTSRKQYAHELQKRGLRGAYWHGENISEL